MVSGQADKVLHRIRTLALQQRGGPTDGNLVDLYVRQKDEAAFEALVRRHGRMVLGVCQRILGNSHDAEDAFQATFLVLVRKAASIQPSEMVGNWLYGVAHRTASEARKKAATRRAREAQVVRRTETPDDVLARLRPFLDQELTRLPDKHRAVVILCDLEGKTRKETAEQLGIPEGTVASRLERARSKLARGLTRHGMTLSAGTLTTALASEATSATPPLSLIATTVRVTAAYALGPAATGAAISLNVAALTEGVLKTMSLGKLKITVLGLVVGIVGTGWGGMSYRTWANDQPAVPIGLDQLAQAEVIPSNPVQTPQDKISEDKSKAENREKRDASDQYGEAFLKAFQISSEIAKAMAKKSADDTKPRNQDQAKHILELMTKALEANKASQGKEGAGPDKDDFERNAEAFLKAFEVSSEIAKSMSPKRAADRDAHDSYGSAFLQAYEKAKMLKTALKQEKASEDKRRQKLLEALNLFLSDGKEFEQAVKDRARSHAIQQARPKTEPALSRVEKTVRDEQMEQILEEIETAMQELKKHIQKKK